MAYRRNYYDPIIETPAIQLPPGVEVDAPEPVDDGMVPAKAILVERTGIYLHVEDVAAALRQMALERPDWAEPLELAAAGFVQPQVIE